MTNFSSRSNFDINNEMNSFGGNKMGFSNPFDAVAASDATTTAPAGADSTSSLPSTVAATTASTAASTIVMTTTTTADAWNSAMSTEAGSTTQAPPTRDFEEMFNDLLVDVEKWAKG